ncbi:MAG: MotA/TolQ/ExbB proton channel family protein [Candidatus Krumholzibacteria bacterium]|nr:MotA/TolQ/ExbB proton channel family protein [Candidatus Krumholzibacteria bacterium]
MYSDINWLEAIGSSPIFIALIGLSVVTLAVAIERILYFWKRRGLADETLDRAVREIRRGDRREAKRVCDSCSHPMGPVAGSIIDSEEPDSEKAEEQLHISLSQQRLLLENNLGILGTMAAIAPLVGLLGTVWGIMRAFRDMSTTGSAAPSIVAAGIAEALTTTAAGLIIAVPALMLYNHLARRISVMLTIAENNSRTLRHELEQSPAPARPDERSGRSDREDAASGDGRKADEMKIEDVAEELETVMAE